MVAAAPCYLKGNSHGEYVFDWSWASAYERNGLDYYPKLLSAVPYSPVTGPRLLVGHRDDATLYRELLIEALRAQTENAGFSSAHLNFASDVDARAFVTAKDWLPRFDWQFHWENQDWHDFSDFLGAMSSKKRKNIRQEREHVARAGITCEILHGDEMSPRDWQIVHAFYEATFDEKGNYPALTLPFFQHLGSAMPRRVLTVIARRGRDPIAAALLLRSSDTLYGRYWGSSENVPGLHFEVCYYQGIDYCLKHGLRPLRTGCARRTQTGARVSADDNALVPLHRRHAISQSDRRCAAARSRWIAGLSRRTDVAFAVFQSGMIRIAVLRAGAHDPFPAVETALADPDGLLAAGGDLSPERLLDAYRHGIFPWFSAGDPILWWSPATRTVFDSNRVHVSDRLRRWLKKCDWTLRADSAFAEVVLACASPRATQPTTWITPEMFAAYLRLHELGYAHSVEIFDGDGLVGGIYGVAVGRMFFGESMFSYATNASKVALIALCRMLASNGFPCSTRRFRRRI